MVVSGRHFSEEVIARIQAAVDEAPELSRRELSRQVCRWIGWESANGKLQEMSCRKALGKLDRRGVLRLPERSRICESRGDRGPRLEIDIPEVKGELEELGDVTVRAVTKRDGREWRIARGMLEQYHYLGAGHLRGAQMRYVVRSSRYGYVGVLTFSSAHWALQDRDRHIGWTERARRMNLKYVVSNDRFLILPTVEVKNLASHVLGMTLRQLPGDWEQRYAVRPVLAETFVDPRRFDGTCYKASNWTVVGQTAGRRDGVAKTIFLHELSSEWRERLLEEPPAPGWGKSVGEEAPASWAQEEFGYVRFYDDRLKQRLYTIAEDFYGQPEASIPEACGGKARTMGAYRFFQNSKVTMDVLLDSHTEATIERIRQHRIVLAPQDTTTLSYTTHPRTEGLGPISHISEGAIGLLMHDTMAFTEEGTPLGIVDAQCWARDPQDAGKSARRKDLPIEQKESAKWLRSFRRLAEIQKACPHTQLVSIGDRESDMYELFLEAIRDPAGPALLVRMSATTQRKLRDEIRLWDFMADQPVAGTLSLHLPRSGVRQARETLMDVRFADIELKPPNRNPDLPTVRACAVYVREHAEYTGNNKALEWMLLTTLKVSSFEEAQQRIAWYTKRWGIEVFHRTLKSGCRIKDRQLGTADGLEACLGIDMVVAWRIFHLTMLGRDTPDSPCSVFFKDEEWKALCCYVSKSPVPPQIPPTLSQAVRMVGQMGGHLGRKSDGPPGTDTLWRGLQRLDIATEMFLIFIPNPILPAGP